MYLFDYFMYLGEVVFVVHWLEHSLKEEVQRWRWKREGEHSVVMMKGRGQQMRHQLRQQSLVVGTAEWPAHLPDQGWRIARREEERTSQIKLLIPTEQIVGAHIIEQFNTHTLTPY